METKFHDRSDTDNLPSHLDMLPHSPNRTLQLECEGNRIGRTLKVDNITLIASRGKFARVCVRIDLLKPLRSRFRLHGKPWRIQYEGFLDICFHCHQYGHRSISCPLSIPSIASDDLGDGSGAQLGKNKDR